MEDIITVIKGTELKLLFTATQGDNAASVDLSRFTIKYFTDGDIKLICSSDESNELRYKRYDNPDTPEEDSNQLLIRVPTENLNPGILKCEATIYVADADFLGDSEDTSDGLEDPLVENTEWDGYRKEILRESTRIKIIQ